ncbi:MAG: hypothetical protein V4710_00920 [Verrucomicrobiota bacterium]
MKLQKFAIQMQAFEENRPGKPLLRKKDAFDERKALSLPVRRLTCPPVFGAFDAGDDPIG